MRSFTLAAILLEETFEGYRNEAELAEAWTLDDPDGVATLTLEDDPYATGGQRRHLALALDGASAALAVQSTAARAFGTYIPGEATTQVGYLLAVRYQADPALAGIRVGARYAHSAFGGSVVTDAVCDGAWHTVSGVITDFAESSLASGVGFVAEDVPAAAGILRFDDLTLTRRSPLARAIDDACPVAAMRCDWGAGVRETLGYRTLVQTADDGSEFREQLRVLPRWRLEYETRAGDAVDAALIDAFLWAHQGERVAVPRWTDALVFASLEQSNTLINLTGGTTDERMFEPEQRVMLWDSPSSFEAVRVFQVNSASLRLDVNVNVVEGSWTPGRTLVVPLLPARLAPDVRLNRPGADTGIVPLAFDVEVAQ